MIQTLLGEKLSEEKERKKEREQEREREKERKTPLIEATTPQGQGYRLCSDQNKYSQTLLYCTCKFAINSHI